MVEESEHQPETTEPEAVANAEVADVTIDVSDDAVAGEMTPGDTPSVDELQGRLADLQGAMDQLQSGDLDGAEATIASLEEAMTSRNSAP